MSTAELEKEVLEEEKNADTTIFKTDLFQYVYEELSNVKGETRKEVKDVLYDGMINFVKEKINNTEPLNEEALKIAFDAGIATVLGGDTARSMRKENMISSAMKRIVRKENMIGFNLLFDDNSKGGCILLKEQYEAAIKDHTLEEIVNSTSNEDGKKIKSITPMSDEELDKILEVTADGIMKGEFNE